MDNPEKTDKVRREDAPVNSGWLQVLDEEAPKFHCPVINETLTSSCQLRGCPLWVANPKVYCCTGAFASIKASNSEDRLSATSSAQREKRGTLRAAADGKLSFHDMSYLFSLSRQRIEGFVDFGKQVMETLTPLFADIDMSGESPDRPAIRRLGSPNLFTLTQPVNHVDGEGDVTRVCICCESVIEPDDSELVLAIIDRYEVAWCSRECAKEFPIDAYMVSNRYKRHWTAVALTVDPIDERSRVREIDEERMEALKQLAVKQGY